MITCAKCGGRVHITGPCRRCERERKEAKPTPGPWFVIDIPGGDSLVAADTPKGQAELVTVHREAEYVKRLPAEANAALIAAAPELLAAVEALVSGLPELWGDQVHSGRLVFSVDEDAVQATFDAIAKAKGGGR